MPVAPSIVEFFDPYNLDHLMAYKHLTATGTWPKRFVPKGMDIPHNWLLLILNKMADAWVESALNGKVEGMPPL